MQIFLYMQPFENFEKIPACQKQGLETKRCICFAFCFIFLMFCFPLNCAGFLIGGFDLFAINARNYINSVYDQRTKMLSGTSRASLSTKTNHQKPLKFLFNTSRKIYCSAGLRPIISNYFISRIYS